ncbi:hypothetical protein NC653_007529 [Populus alba x Populus x berolinensis]|uniref:Uncharacterized protein n=1 Tax=Populus alba x Populus x berolinensis TaxID=444605 RepID=A0AAD6RHN0_9ROSI|nr:hypothetical protein NC653_007529 [Populus alba x Populus x berolinensis]
MQLSKSMKFVQTRPMPGFGSIAAFYGMTT